MWFLWWILIFRQEKKMAKPHTTSWFRADKTQRVKLRKILNFSFYFSCLMHQKASQYSRRPTQSSRVTESLKDSPTNRSKNRCKYIFCDIFFCCSTLIYHPENTTGRWNIYIFFNSIKFINNVILNSSTTHTYMFLWFSISKLIYLI